MNEIGNIKLSSDTTATQKHNGRKALHLADGFDHDKDTDDEAC